MAVAPVEVKADASRLPLASPPRYPAAMTDQSKDERLAAALRANLRKRKAQTRAVKELPRPVLGPDAGGDE